MKLIYLLLIIFGASFLILGFILVYPVLILEYSWWLFFGALIFEIVAGIITGTIFLIIKLSKKLPKRDKLDIKTAISRAVNIQKHDEDNPDNFVVKERELWKRGDDEILNLIGKGTELNENRNALIDLNKPKKDILILINKTPEEIKQKIFMMAGWKPEEIKEEIITEPDILGRPVTKIMRTKPTEIEKKIEEEQKKAEVESGL